MFRKLLSNKHALYLLCVIVFALMPLLWFKGAVLSGEEYYGADYGQWGTRLTSTWFGSVNYGNPDQAVQFRLQGLFFRSLYSLGFSVMHSEMIWMVLLSVLGAVGCYLFLSELFEKPIPYAQIFVTTLFYIYNPFFLNISPLLSPPRIVMSLLPVILLFLTRHFKTQNLWHLMYLVIVLFLATPAFANEAAASILYFPVGAYFIFEFIASSQRVKTFLHYCALFLGLVIVNVWWFVPLIFVLRQKMGDIYGLAQTFSAINSTALFEALAGFGSWAFRSRFGNYSYFAYNVYYYTFPLVALKYVSTFFIVYYMYLVVNKQFRQTAIFKFFIVMYLGALLLSKGTRDAFGSVFEMLFNKVPGFWMYREPYAKFMPLLLVVSTPLIAVSLVHVYKAIRNWKYSVGVIFMVLVAGVFIAVGYPYLTGEVIWDTNNGTARSFRIRPPEDWTKFAKNSQQYVGGYYLLYPTSGYTSKYNWPSGYSGNKVVTYTGINTIREFSDLNGDKNVTNVVLDMHDKVLNFSESIPSLSTMYGLEGLIFQKDLVDDQIRLQTPTMDKLKKWLVFSDSVTDLYRFGQNIPNVRILPKDATAEVRGEPSDNYAKIRDIVDVNKMLVYSGSGKDLVALTKKDIEDGRREFQVPEGITGDYQFYVKGVDAGGVLSILYDSTPLPADAVIHLDGSCCHTVTVNYKPQIPIPVSHEELTYGNITPDGMTDFSTTINEHMMVAERETFSMGNQGGEGTYKMAIVGDAAGDVHMQFYERDVTTGVEKMLLSGYIQSLHGSISARADIKFNYRLSKNIEYLIKLDSPTIPGYSGINVKSLSINKLNNPLGFLVKPSVKTSTGSPGFTYTPVDFKKISEGLYVVAPTGSNLGYLQLMQSYNKNWQAYSIDGQTYANVKNNKPFALTLLVVRYAMFNLIKPGIAPVNIESMSSGWDTASLDPSRPVMIIFKTEGFYLVTFTLACFFVVGLLIARVLVLVKKGRARV
jgi:hypothetical protein